MIAEFLDQSPHAQKEMYNFCLVGRAWYMAGIKLLYRRPNLARGSRFAQFTSTIIPPIRTKKQKVDLASLVERLSLGQLVHQSSPSQTARLLKATSSSLIEFRAPRISFA